MLTVAISKRNKLQNIIVLTPKDGDAFVAQVNKRVVDWLFGHIKTFDRSVAEYKNMRKNSEMI